MNILWSIAKKDLLQVLKDRNSFLLLLIVPVILVTILGMAFSNGIGGNTQSTQFTVAVSNQDTGLIGQALLKALQAKHDGFQITLHSSPTAHQLSQEVTDGHAVAGLLIPAKTTQQVSDAASQGKSVSRLVQLYIPPNSTDQRVALTQQIVTTILNSQVDMIYTGSAAVQQVLHAVNQLQRLNCTASVAQSESNCQSAADTVNAAAILQAVGQASPTSKHIPLLQISALGTVPKVNSFDRSLPGFAILFALFGLNTAAASILQEKDDGTFRRLLIAPVPRYALLGGKLLAQFVLTLLQLTLLFGIGALVFKLSIGSWPLIALLLVSTSIAITGLGMLLVSLLKTRRQLPPIVTLTTLVTSAIGGSWWPLWSEPQWMQQVAKIGVTAWALEGLNAVMIFGKGFAEVKFDILGLFGYGLICFVLALRLFRFQEKEA